MESVSTEFRTQNRPNLLPSRTPAPPDFEKRVVSQPTEIISVGSDRELLRLRERLLHRVGRCILSMPPENAEIESHSAKTRLWLFCNTVDLDELLYLASNVRRYSPGSRLLLLEGVRPVRFEAPLFHRVLEATDGIDTLLAAVSELAFTA